MYNIDLTIWTTVICLLSVYIALVDFVIIDALVASQNLLSMTSALYKYILYNMKRMIF